VPPRADPAEVVSSEGKIRCVLVHDYVLLRQGLRRLLDDEPDIDVISEAGNAAECLRKVHELRPDVVVADAETFGMPAPEAEVRVARESPHTKLVFVSMQAQTPSVLGDFGVAGDCAARQTSAEELVEMVRNSCAGNRLHNGDGSAAFGRLHLTGARSGQQPLTAREREVLKLLAEGKTVRASAAILGLSIKTVDAHKFNLMRKLGVHNKAELVMRAIQKKIVKVPVNF
jgi:two-component system, NarL family, response regulator NreC